jgi:hypothetical protein
MKGVAKVPATPFLFFQKALPGDLAVCHPWLIRAPGARSPLRFFPCRFSNLSGYSAVVTRSAQLSEKS